MPAIDWALLRDTAIAAMQHSYSPYSGFAVGAAGLVDDGRIVTGCNVENVSYGLGLCAECVLVGNLRCSGGRNLVAVSCCNPKGTVLLPCGRCRQVLYEHGGPDMFVDHPGAPVPLAALLPDAFGVQDLRQTR